MTEVSLYGLLRQWVLGIQDAGDSSGRPGMPPKDRLSLPPALPPVLPTPGEQAAAPAKRKRQPRLSPEDLTAALNSRSEDPPTNLLEEHMVQFKRVKIDHLKRKAIRLRQSEDRLRLLLGDFSR